LISKENSECAIVEYILVLTAVGTGNPGNIKREKTMKMRTKILTLAVLLVSTSASASWWNDDHDYWDRGPWYGGYPGYGGWGGYGPYGWGGYPGYGGWGGYPGYGGWGGYPGYGGWGGQPTVIYTQPQGSESSQDYRIR
jgi:hypothetical protein